AGAARRRPRGVVSKLTSHGTTGLLSARSRCSAWSARDLAAGRAERETAVATVMAHQDPLAEALAKRAAEIVRLVVVDERTRVDTHPAALLHDHLRERTHEAAPRL